MNNSDVKLRGEVKANVNFKHHNENYCIPMIMGTFDDFYLLFLLGNDLNKTVGLTINCKNQSVSFNPELRI